VEGVATAERAKRQCHGETRAKARHRAGVTTTTAAAASKVCARACVQLGACWWHARQGCKFTVYSSAEVSFQYTYRNGDSIVLVSICGRLMHSPFQYISKIIPTVSPGHLPRHRQWRELTVALRAMPGSRFAGAWGAPGNARQPFRWGGRRCGVCQAAILRGAAALAVSPEQVVAEALGGPVGTAPAGRPCLPRTPHCPPPARAPLPGAQCSCAAVAHRLPPLCSITVLKCNFT